MGKWTTIAEAAIELLSKKGGGALPDTTLDSVPPKALPTDEALRLARIRRGVQREEGSGGSLRDRYASILREVSGGKDHHRIRLTPDRIDAAKAVITREFDPSFFGSREEYLDFLAASPTKQMVNATDFARTMLRAGEKVRFKMPDGPMGSLYVRVGDKGSVRFSDHPQPYELGAVVGGYSKDLGRRHMPSTYSVDPASGLSVADVIQRFLPDALPMDEASRMARAQEMGFDETPLFHGTSNDITEFVVKKNSTGEFGPAVYLTTSPGEAAGYAGTHRGGQNVMPVMARLKNPMKVGSPDEFWQKFGAGTDDAGAVAAAKKAGHDGVIIERPVRQWDETSKSIIDTGETSQHYIVFDPSNVRSRFAQFDPAKAGSPDILAGLGVVGAGAALSQQDGFDYGALSNVVEESNVQSSN
jgi:hypothetical protein